MVVMVVVMLSVVVVVVVSMVVVVIVVSVVVVMVVMLMVVVMLMCVMVVMARVVISVVLMSEKIQNHYKITINWTIRGYPYYGGLLLKYDVFLLICPQIFINTLL